MTVHMLTFIVFILILMCIIGAIMDGDPFMLFIVVLELLSFDDCGSC